MYNTTVMVIIMGESQNHWNIQNTLLFNRFSRHATKSTYPVCTSHIFIVLSLEADTIWSPLGMMATEETLWSWPKTHNTATYWVIHHRERLNLTLPLDFTMGFQIIQQLQIYWALYKCGGKKENFKFLHKKRN